MKRTMILFGAVVAALFLCRDVQAVAGGEIAVDTNLTVNGSVNSTISIRTDGMNWASAEVVVTSATQPSLVFGDGQAATATLTVGSYTGLSTATASGTFTAVSTTVAVGVVGSASVAINSNVSGTQIAITGPPGALNYMVGGNVAQGYSSTNTAVNFSVQVNLSSNTSGVTSTVNASSTAVTISCLSAGTFCNSYAVTSSSPTAISTAAFSGGTNPVTVTVGGAQFTAGNQFAVGANTTVMATNLAAAIAASSGTIGITAASASTIVSATATVAGTAGNSYPTLTSNALAISTAALTMSGGQNNASVCINGYCWTANTSSTSFSPTAWYPATSNTATATGLAATINASSVTTGVAAASAGAIVSATATVVGVAANSYVVTVTTNAITPAVLVSSSATTGAQVGVMSGGLAAGYTFNGTGITAFGNTLYTGESVYFTSTTGNTALYYSSSTTGTKTVLTYGSTFYAIAGNPVQLSTTSALAVSGLPIVFVSSQVKTTQDTFTLNTSNIAGTPSYKWLVSDDNTNWMPYTTTPLGQTISSATISAYVSTGTVNVFDFGHMDYGWLGLGVVTPTSGAINMSVKVIGKAQ